MKQYAVDLRERLLRAIDAGLSQAEAFRLFGVGTSTITRWRGIPMPRWPSIASGGSRPQAVRLSVAAMSRTMRRLGITLKKSPPRQ